MSVGLDLGPVIDLLGWETVTVTRTPASFNSHGVSVRGTPTTFSATGSAQPLGGPLGGSLGPNSGGRAGLAGNDGRNVDLNERGQRLHGAIVFFSHVELYAARGAQFSDSLVWRGDEYDVVHSEQWDATGYWRSTLSRRTV